MKVLIAFTLALILTAASSLDLNENKVVPRGRIYNGQKADNYRFPYIVGLNVRSTNPQYTWCGGSLISNSWILTAAHCLKDIFEIQVFLGSANRRNSEKIITVGPQDTFIHNNYNVKSGEHDIALIKIPAIQFSSNIQAINLPTGAESIFAGDNAFIAGWGSTVGYSDASTDTLMWSQTKIVSTEACYDVYRDNLPQLAICADGSKSAICQADSGGPLTLQSRNVLIGVTYGYYREGCDKGSPSIFTSVIPHLKWIYRIMRSN